MRKASDTAFFEICPADASYDALSRKGRKKSSQTAMTVAYHIGITHKCFLYPISFLGYILHGKFTPCSLLCFTEYLPALSGLFTFPVFHV